MLDCLFMRSRENPLGEESRPQYNDLFMCRECYRMSFSSFCYFLAVVPDESSTDQLPNEFR